MPKRDGKQSQTSLDPSYMYVPDQSHAFLTPDRHRKLQTRTPDKTVQQSDTHAKYAAFHRAQLHTHASEPPKNMGWLHRANEKEHWTCQMHALR